MRGHLIRFVVCAAVLALLHAAGLGPWQALAAGLAVVLISNVVVWQWREED